MTDDLNTPSQEDNLTRQKQEDANKQPYADRPEQGQGDLRQEQDDVPAQEPPS